MSLILHLHPLSSYCQKVIIALYENDTPFTANLVNLGEPAEREALQKLWRVGKFPVLEDKARGEVVPESSIIIDYLGQHYPGPSQLLPTDRDAARKVRLVDRFYDLHLHEHMQKVIGDRLRPEDKRDPHGVAEARTRIRRAYDIIEVEMTGQTWAAGSTFSMADCAALPPLFYANMVEPIEATHPAVAAYFARLKQRPSIARVLKEAEPYLHLVPR